MDPYISILAQLLDLFRAVRAINNFQLIMKGSYDDDDDDDVPPSCDGLFRLQL